MASAQESAACSELIADTGQVRYLKQDNPSQEHKVPDIDLDELSLKELKNLQAQVAKSIATFEDRRKKGALLELEEKARELGYSLAELTGTTVARKRASAGAKYANPANPEETWSGRGRKPRWFDEALRSGKSTDDLRV